MSIREPKGFDTGTPIHVRTQAAIPTNCQPRRLYASSLLVTEFGTSDVMVPGVTTIVRMTQSVVSNVVNALGSHHPTDEDEDDERHEVMDLLKMLKEYHLRPH